MTESPFFRTTNNTLTFYSHTETTIPFETFVYDILPKDSFYKIAITEYCTYSQPILVPKNITKITLGSLYKNKLLLSKCLEYLSICAHFNCTHALQFSKNIRVFESKRAFESINAMGKKIVVLTIECDTQKTKLSKNIKRLTIKSNCPILTLPKKLSSITVGTRHRVHIVCSSYLKTYASKNSLYDPRTVLPEYLDFVEINPCAHFVVENLPNNVKNIKFGIHALMVPRSRTINIMSLMCVLPNNYNNLIVDKNIWNNQTVYVSKQLYGKNIIVE